MVCVWGEGERGDEDTIIKELIREKVVLRFPLSPFVGPLGGLTIAEVDHVHLTFNSCYGLQGEQSSDRSCDWSCD